MIGAGGAAPILRQLGPDAKGRSWKIRAGKLIAVDRIEIDDREVDCSSLVFEAGRVNGHTHIYSGLAPLGIPPPMPSPETFLHILERLWWRLDRALDAASLEASARLYVAEALLAGTSTLIDHHESPELIEGSLDIIADVCEVLGIRAVLCFGATERNFGRDEARRGLAECRRFIRSNRRRLVRGVVGLHASFTVSDDTIREAGDLCRELGTVLHVHVAEDIADVSDARRREYAGPLERLIALGALPPGSIMAHGVHLDKDQVRMAADHGLWLVQNPRSNRGNGVGYPPALHCSPLVALGTDGYPARLTDEIEALQAGVEEHHENPALVELRAAAGWRLASSFFEQRFEPLEDGAAADVSAVDTDSTPRQVVVAGRLVVRDGELMTGQIGDIRAQAAAEAECLWQRMRALP